MHSATVLTRSTVNVDAELAYWHDVHAEGQPGGHAFADDARVLMLGYDTLWRIPARPKRSYSACCSTGYQDQALPSVPWDKARFDRATRLATSAGR